MFNRCIGYAVNAMILFSDSSNNLTPAEAIKIKKVGDGIKWRGRCLFEIDEFEGFEIQLAEGFGREYPG
jgi:CYTH domain-containing protein